MKIKVLDCSIINKSKSNQKIIFDIKILESEKDVLVNKNFSNRKNDLSFKVLSVGHINPPIENFYPLIVDIDNNHSFEKYKGLVFTDEK